MTADATPAACSPELPTGPTRLMILSAGSLMWAFIWRPREWEAALLNRE